MEYNEETPLIKKAEERPEIGKKLLTFLQERPILQEGFLRRKEWEEKTKELLSKGKILVMIVDLVGSTNLLNAGRFAEIMGKVVGSIKSWKKLFPESTLLTPGRTIEVRRRETGEDEILVTAQSEEESSIIINRLISEIEKSCPQDSVYIGASENSAGTVLSRALRGADIALGMAKEEKKKNPQSKGIKTAQITNNSAKIDDQAIKETEMEITHPAFPENVVTHQPLDQLRQLKGKFLVVSPLEMKQINKIRGMEGGNQVLVEITEKINELVGVESIEEKAKIYKIVTIFVIPKESLTKEKVDILAQSTDFGLGFTQIELD